MAIVQRADSTVGPVAIEGRTITLVSRAHAVRVGRDPGRAVQVRSRPRYVEVLHHDGRREVVRIHDVERALIAAIAFGAIAAACTARAVAKRRWA